METGDASSSEPSRPKWLSPVIISAIVVGTLVSCCGLFTIGSVVFNSMMQERLATFKQMPKRHTDWHSDCEPSP